MNNQEMINLLNGIPSLYTNGGLTDALDFFYELSKIEDALQAENKIIQKTLNSITGLDAYEKEKLVIIKKYCKKDKNGRLVMSNSNSFEIDESSEEVADKEMKDLNEKYKDALSQRKELLERESKAKFDKIKFSLVPGNIKGVHYRIIKDLIEK